MISPDLKKFLFEHRDDNLDRLALQAAKFPEIDIPFALQQLKGRKIAKEKIPTWSENEEIVYPKQLSMEQCSSEKTAQFKSQLAKGNVLVDLTGGMGVDFYFMAQGFEKSIYVEQQRELEQIANHNFKALGLNSAETYCENGVDFLQKMNFRADTIFIDPARRADSGRKTVLLQDCTPDLTTIDDLLSEKSVQTIIKLSPMLDITSAVQALKNVVDVYVIAIQNEVKELLLVKKSVSSDLQIHTINFKKDETEEFSFNYENEKNTTPLFSTQIQRFLYEPNAAVLKAGAYKIIANRFSINKLHINSHLYASETLAEGFPGRVFEVIDTFSFSNSEIKRLHQVTNKTNISIRNFPSSVEELRKKLKMTDGGDFYLFATTLSDNQKRLILTQKVS